MTELRYSVGDQVLVSREENGENHELGKVVDSYELIMGEERRPAIVVEFDDGERKYITPRAPNVLPVEPEEDESAEEETEEGAEEGHGTAEAGLGAEANGDLEAAIEGDDQA